jgi:hypothetical protein
MSTPLKADPLLGPRRPERTRERRIEHRPGRVREPAPLTRPNDSPNETQPVATAPRAAGIQPLPSERFYTRTGRDGRERKIVLYRGVKNNPRVSIEDRDPSSIVFFERPGLPIVQRAIDAARAAAVDGVYEAGPFGRGPRRVFVAGDVRGGQPAISFRKEASADGRGATHTILRGEAFEALARACTALAQL